MLTKSVFCTLGEGDYRHGMATLLNSLVQNGFVGVFAIGWRGAPPPWLDALESHPDGGWRVGAVRVRLELLDTPWLLAHVKPSFMLDLLCLLEPQSPTCEARVRAMVIEDYAAFLGTRAMILLG